MSQKNKKRGKNQKSRDEKQKREIVFAEENQMYAVVEKMLGNCRLAAKCMDGKSRICHIRGKLRKRVWIREDSVILIGLRQFEDDKADVIHCYFPEEVRRLKTYGELPEDVGEGGEGEEGDGITWEAEADPEEGDAKVGPGKKGDTNEAWEKEIEDL